MTSQKKLLGSVLVVDDNTPTRMSLQCLLEEDFVVNTAKNIHEAIAFLSKHSMDVVVTDYDMPGGSGVELLRHLAAHAPLCVGILFTGQPNHPEVTQARGEASFLIVPKSYEPKLLLERVKNAVCLSQLRQARKRLTSNYNKSEG
jgi:DNA-binding NtrC family response regulator